MFWESTDVQQEDDRHQESGLNREVMERMRMMRREHNDAEKDIYARMVNFNFKSLPSPTVSQTRFSIFSTM